MGSEDFYPEERPVHRVHVDGFWMDEHPVTAAEFRRFVRATRYVTVAERPLDPADYPGALPELLVPGAPPTIDPIPVATREDDTAYTPGPGWPGIPPIPPEGSPKAKDCD